MAATTSRPHVATRPSRVLRRRRSAAIAASLVVATSAVSAAPALAGPYEQVTRANGAQGNAAFTASNVPLAVSDSGRYAVFSPRGTLAPTFPVVLRDIVANTTRELSPNSIPIGFDKAETKFAAVEPSADGQSLAVWVRPTSGGPGRKVVDLDPSDLASYAFSGNGNVVAVAGEFGNLKLYDAATGAVVRTVAESNLTLNPRSLSDDGQIVAGTRSSSSGFYVKADGMLVERDAPSLVSPDGKVVVSGGSNTTTLSTTQVASGTERTFPDAPYGVLWVAPDGSSLIAPDHDIQDGSAQRVDLKTGQVTNVGGAFGGDLDGNLLDPSNATQTSVSRSGRYGLIQYARALSNQLALVDLTGADLPGTQEPLSASSYLPFAPPISFSCSTQPELTLVGLYTRPAKWAPKPRLAVLQIKVDGKVALNKTFTKPFDVNEPGTLPSSIQLPIPTAAKKIQISAVVLDDKLRPVSDTQTTAPICVGGWDDDE